AGKLSLIHVDDLAELLLALTRRGAPKKAMMEPDDGRPGGWTHREFGAALAQAVGVPARTIATPRFLLALGSRLDRLLRRDRPNRAPLRCLSGPSALTSRACPTAKRPMPKSSS